MDQADKNRISRRGALRRFLSVAGGAAAIAVLDACGLQETSPGRTETARSPSPHCTDTSLLSPEQKKLREEAYYVDETPMPNKRCDNCLNFVAAKKAGACGSCKVVAGPINPQGFCTLWQPLQNGRGIKDHG